MNNLYNILMKFIKKSIINLFFLCLLLLYGCAEKKFSELDIVIEARNFFTEHPENAENLKNEESGTDDLKDKNKPKTEKQKVQEERIIEDKKQENEVIQNLPEIKEDKEKIIDTIKIDEMEKNKKDKAKSQIIYDALDEMEKEKRILKNETEKNITNFGVLLPLSGKNKVLGKAFLESIELALFDLKNPKIKLIIKDNKSDPLIAKQEFMNLLKNEVKIIIGPIFSDSVLAIDSLAKINNIPVLAFTNNTSLARRGLWTLGIDPSQQVRRVIDFMIKDDKQKFAALLPDNRYGNIINNSIEDILSDHGLKLERNVFYSKNNNDLEIAVKKISQGFESLPIKPEKENSFIEEGLMEEEFPFEAIVIAASGEELRILSAQLEYNNVDPDYVQFLGTTAWRENNVIGEPSLVGALFSSTVGYKNNEIKIRYKALYRKNMPLITMLSYDALALAEDSLIDGDVSIKRLVKKDGFLGLRGLFRLNDNGTVERSLAIYKVKNKNFIIVDQAPKSFINYY